MGFASLEDWRMGPESQLLNNWQQTKAASWHYAVLKVKAKGHRDNVTVVGSLPSVSAGEWVTAEGRWVQDRELGHQFRAETLKSTAPSTKKGCEKFLTSLGLRSGKMEFWAVLGLVSYLAS